MPRIWFDRLGGAGFKDWRQHAARLEDRILALAKRAEDSDAQIRGYLADDGRIPGALASVKQREQVLTSSSLLPTATVDFSKGLRALMLITADMAKMSIVVPPLAPREVVFVTLSVMQDATGNRQIASWSSNVYFPNDILPEFSTDPGHVDMLSGYASGTTGTIRFVHSDNFAG